MLADETLKTGISPTMEAAMSHKGKVLGALLFACLFAATIAHAADFFGGLSVGYKAGLSFRGSGGFANFAQGFPLSMEFSLTYSNVAPGEALAARRVFIANATNGTPESSGTTWAFAMDFLYNLNLKGTKGIYLFAGPRYAMFDAHFRYVGANEEFDVTSNPWGIGLGMKGLFAITNKVDLMLSAGVDNFFDTSIHGHDTTYNPDDQNINAHEDFTYKDAKNAVNTPRIQGVLLIGLTYTF